ncbi:hypothetical protein MmTuc01_2965 [Methanosarcina mazei Tuc01]|uniref:Uncharacterized protein n=1 Tax=Methanosarcina mazei Tuc01 TaxID=1236903 RepID=M1Q7B6_METMZ|nr:hypothetical protein MmTuc01_2965 [Methanosarcina mazei Tuc01]
MTRCRIDPEETTLQVILSRYFLICPFRQNEKYIFSLIPAS